MSVVEQLPVFAELESLGSPRDSWEREMIAVGTNELVRLARCLDSSGEQAPNAIGYVGGLVYAIRRRREMLEDGAL